MRCETVNTFADGTIIPCAQEAAKGDHLCCYDRKVADGLMQPSSRQYECGPDGGDHGGLCSKEDGDGVFWTGSTGDLLKLHIAQGVTLL